MVKFDRSVRRTIVISAMAFVFANEVLAQYRPLSTSDPDRRWESIPDHRARDLKAFRLISVSDGTRFSMNEEVGVRERDSRENRSWVREAFNKMYPKKKNENPIALTNIIAEMPIAEVRFALPRYGDQCSFGVISPTHERDDGTIHTPGVSMPRYIFGGEFSDVDDAQLVDGGEFREGRNCASRYKKERSADNPYFECLIFEMDSDGDGVKDAANEWDIFGYVRCRMGWDRALVYCYDEYNEPSHYYYVRVRYFTPTYPTDIHPWYDFDRGGIEIPHPYHPYWLSEESVGYYVDAEGQPFWMLESAWNWLAEPENEGFEEGNSGVPFWGSSGLLEWEIDQWQGFFEGWGDDYVRREERNLRQHFRLQDHIRDFVGTGVGSTVVGRHIFYENSYYDTATPQNPSFNDSTAIAPDKVALLPGQTATFANYTSYTRGINGVMIDVSDLGSASNIGADDFMFKVGNNNDPSGWSAAPAPTSVEVMAGAGDGGSDRIKIVWADNAINKQWLEVTVLANADTGLAENDVFYFGNAPGDSGDNPSNTLVNSNDILGPRSNPKGLFPRNDIRNVYDYNRDDRVDSSDILFARSNPVAFFAALRLISVPASSSGSGGLIGSSYEPIRLDSVASIQLVIRRNETTGQLVVEANNADPEGVELQFKEDIAGEWQSAPPAENTPDGARWTFIPGPRQMLYRLIQK